MYNCMWQDVGLLVVWMGIKWVTGSATGQTRVKQCEGCRVVHFLACMKRPGLCIVVHRRPPAAWCRSCCASAGLNACLATLPPCAGFKFFEDYCVARLMRDVDVAPVGCNLGPPAHMASQGAKPSWQHRLYIQCALMSMYCFCPRHGISCQGAAGRRLCLCVPLVETGKPSCMRLHVMLLRPAGTRCPCLRRP